MMCKEEYAFYERLVDEYKDKLTQVQKKIYIVGSLRLVCVILTGMLLFIYWSQGAPVLTGLVLVGVILFCILLVVHNKLYIRKSYNESVIALCEKELRLFNYDFTGIDDGERYRNAAHDYTNDLDIFGHKSLYSYMNRSASFIGNDRFAELLQNPYINPDIIRKRQDAVAEIVSKPLLRVRFQALGGISEEKTSDKNDILALIRTSMTSLSPVIKFIVRVLPFLWVAGILAFLLNWIDGIWLLFPFIALVLFAFMRSKYVTQVQSQVNAGLSSLKIYARLFEVIEQEKFKSEGLTELSDALSVSGEKVSRRIKNLSSILSDLDQRCNGIAFVILNGLFLWDFRQLAKIENWQAKNAMYLESWLKTLAEFDVYCTLGSFGYNHPDYVFPELNETDSPAMEAEDMGHPLIQPEDCVRNDVQLLKRPSFLVITGANMAGKSTYLRTIGINFILAMMGAPVCAKKMEITPCRLYTSLRTTDSLTENESYFFAELKRLQQMIDRLKSGEKLFIILDEILKGTNSVDKQRGSLALVERLVRLNAVGVIATHDLQLGTLAGQFPEVIRNFRFEAEIKYDELFFPYKLQSGIAENMNAYFLMKKMGIIIN